MPGRLVNTSMTRLLESGLGLNPIPLGKKDHAFPIGMPLYGWNQTYEDDEKITENVSTKKMVRDFILSLYHRDIVVKTSRYDVFLDYSKVLQ